MSAEATLQQETKHFISFLSINQSELSRTTLKISHRISFESPLPLWSQINLMLRGFCSSIWYKQLQTYQRIIVRRKKMEMKPKQLVPTKKNKAKTQKKTKNGK
jgi:hypothetical protein